MAHRDTLVIRHEQLEALAWSQRRRFERQLLQALCACRPHRSHGGGEAATGELVRRAMDRAEALGFRSRADVARFAYLALVRGPELEQHPEAARILADPIEAPAAKLDRLFACFGVQLPAPDGAQPRGAR